MTQTALTSPILHIAIEMSNRTWKLGIQGAGRRRFVDVAARDLDAFSQAINLAKRRLRLPENAQVASCYEAGRDGFWLHRALLAMGIENVVIDPASVEVNRRARRKKTDNLDVKKLLNLLIRHVGGEEGVWSVVRVPDIEIEDARRDTRERDRLAKETTQHSNRIRSLLVANGVDIKSVTRRFPKHLEALRLWDDSPLPPRLKQELLREHARWLLADTQLKELDKRRRHLVEGKQEAASSVEAKQIAEVAHLQRLFGIGERGSWKLTQEYFWRDFANRREVGAAAGLTGTPYDSGDSEREQGISKAGSRPIRALMVELSWCWLRFQPQSELSLWFVERTKLRRARKPAIVALARRLLIALWRYVKDGVVPAGAIVQEQAA